MRIAPLLAASPLALAPIIAQRARLEGRSSDKTKAGPDREPELGAQAEMVLFAARALATAGKERPGAPPEEYGHTIAARARRAKRR